MNETDIAHLIETELGTYALIYIVEFIIKIAIIITIFVISSRLQKANDRLEEMEDILASINMQLKYQSDLMYTEHKNKYAGQKSETERKQEIIEYPQNEIKSKESSYMVTPQSIRDHFKPKK